MKTKEQEGDGFESKEMGILARLGAHLADWSEKWFPDAYIFAAIAVVVVCVAALFAGRSFMDICIDFGKSFWGLIPFTMQMTFVIIGGYIVAVSPPVKKLIEHLASFPKTPKTAVAYVAFMAMVASLLSWGFSLIFAGVLTREVSKRVKGIDYRAIGAAAYLGLGSIWALGFSSSAALLMATKGSIPPDLYKISGIIPLLQTILTYQNLIMIVVLIVLSVWICYVSCPSAAKAKTAEMAGISYQSEADGTSDKAQTPGEYLEYSPILTVVIVLLGAGYLFHVFYTKGGLAAMDLNVYNLMFLIIGMLLHWKPKSYLKAAAKGRAHDRRRAAAVSIVFRDIWRSDGVGVDRGFIAFLCFDLYPGDIACYCRNLLGYSWVILAFRRRQVDCRGALYSCSRQSAPCESRMDCSVYHCGQAVRRGKEKALSTQDPHGSAQCTFA